MKLFGKKKSTTNSKKALKEYNNVKFDMDKTHDAYIRGVISLASEYYTALPMDEKYRLSTIYTQATGVKQDGRSIIDATHGLTLKQLRTLQTLIEEDYKITKH